MPQTTFRMQMVPMSSALQRVATLVTPHYATLPQSTAPSVARYIRGSQEIPTRARRLRMVGRHRVRVMGAAYLWMLGAAHGATMPGM
jgi:hypothetical protein